VLGERCNTLVGEHKKNVKQIKTTIMKINQIILAVSMLLTITACNKPTIDQQAEAEKLMELSRSWAKSVKDKEVEKMLSYWADDAIVMSPNEPSVVGIEALRGMVERSMKIPGFEINWEPQKAYVSKSGDLGYVIIKNYMTMPIDTLGNTRTIFNKGVEIWKKQENGTWKNVIDISNPDPSINSIE
jgi:ketosteroid isomerase-like protein